MSPFEAIGALLVIGVAFTVSASAGLGGSLVLVPALSLALGTKEGVALAALLLAANNVVKVVAYRGTVPWRPSVGVAAATMIGAAAGATLLAAAPERTVTLAVVASIVGTLVVERAGLMRARRVGAPGLALGAGLTSGFSGTSGPLKGVAIRSLGLDRMHTVGAASVVSWVGDATKTAVYADAQLLGGGAVALALAAVPIMLVATFGGRALNRRLGERGYTMLFWGVLGGYTCRLLAGL